MTKRTQIITAEHFGLARRAATRAALAARDPYEAGRAAVAALDAAFDRYARPVDEPALAIAGGQLESVSSQQLRELIRDCNAELLRPERSSA